MAESTLSLDWSELLNRIGQYAGWGRESDPGVVIKPSSLSNWTNAKYIRIDQIAKGGLRQFLNPPPIGGSSYTWGFLKPETTVTMWATTTGTVSGNGSYSSSTGLTTITVTAAAFYDTMVGASFTFDTSSVDYVVRSVISSTVIVVEGDAGGEAADDTYTMTANGSYRMPDDFGGIYGDMHFDPDSGVRLTCVERPLGTVRALLQRDDTPGTPRYFALATIVPTALQGQRWNVLLYPIADGNYPMTFRFVPNPDAIGLSFPYPYGGPAHAETISASCLAMAELDLNRVRGERWQYFMERLAASIQLDREIYQPKRLGVMVDRSDKVECRGWSGVFTTAAEAYDPR